jgi:hypothetical protein
MGALPERESVRSRRLSAASKSVRRELLREEADTILPCFRTSWEPLRDVAARTPYSASQLASRARDLQRRGLIESKWVGRTERTQHKLWRSLGRPVAVHASGPSPTNHRS